VPGPVLPSRINGGLFNNLLIPDILRFNSSAIKILPSTSWNKSFVSNILGYLIGGRGLLSSRLGTC
jgi:hypothetical protein